MKLDNFTTARCRNCGWLKQFHPGREYVTDDFICDCKKKKEVEVSKIDNLKKQADKLGISYAHNIKEETLAKKIKEVEDGNES